jgi:hypothetical protein
MTFGAESGQILSRDARGRVLVSREIAATFSTLLPNVA